jgi:MYXO-CTERM domain-containing protein
MIMAMLAVAATLVLGLAGTAMAGVVDFRTAQQNETSLIHHYTFEISGKRADDSKGTLDLQGYGSPDFDTGYDTTTTAMNTGSGGISTGAYWPVPDTITVEFLVKVNEHGGTADREGYAVMTLAEDGSRGHWGRSDSNSTFKTWLGYDTITNTGFTPTLGDWYYVAVVANDSNNTATQYHANLSAGERTLQAQSLSGFDSFSGSSRIAIGMRPPGTQDVAYGLRGMVDEVAFYNTELDTTTLQAHYDELLPPEVAPTPPPVSEPTGLGLLGLALLGLRKRRS